MEGSSNQAFDSDDNGRCFHDYDRHEFADNELSKNVGLCSDEVDSVIEQSNENLLSTSDIVEPYFGMEFNSRDDAREFYIAYGRHIGFIVRIHHNRRSRVNNMVIGQDFVCSKEGFREKKYICRKDRVLPPPPITREGCPAMLRLALRDGVKWVVTKFIKEHNHPLMSPDKVPWRGSAKNLFSESLLYAIEDLKKMGNQQAEKKF
ncbi:protein FAR1-RELATED SEQUENCE 5 isoform X2 [Manihot esculenta]|uniref:protein FAR1-RELATED SEQUENCE 5 isoform X2 n=1 Tax=Manihot esculenta TaxID=3983 RepID=UPI000B5D68EA|nr:protein FAR1-RELATED SEQUENCE 5 isoform X2 [Manihot esculenta]